MKLFLTSSPCDNKVPAGISLPCIWNHSNGFVDLLKQYLPKDRINTVIFPADPDNYNLNDEMMLTFHNCLVYDSFPIESTILIDHRFRGSIENAIKNSDLIILGGGYVPTQMGYFREIGLKNLLSNYPGVIIGISAGSMNCADTVYALPEETGDAVNPEYERFIKGLGLTDISIIPHLNKLRDSKLDGLRLFEDIAIPDSEAKPIYAFPDGSFITCIDYAPPSFHGEIWKLYDGVMVRMQ